jgi:hypothetical protein
MAGSRVLSADTIRHFAKVGVEGSNPFARSIFSFILRDDRAYAPRNIVLFARR